MKDRSFEQPLSDDRDVRRKMVAILRVLATSPDEPLGARAIGRELLSVFVPTCPTPVTGFVITVPKDEVIDLPISIDEAFQYIISVGVIMPPAERLESLEVALLVKDGQDEARAADEARRPPDADRPSPPGDAD